MPYFNAPIYLENKTQIGKVEEILGQINNVVGGKDGALSLMGLVLLHVHCFVCAPQSVADFASHLPICHSTSRSR